MNHIRALLHSRRVPLGVMVTAVIALVSATGVALAQDTSGQNAATESQASADPTTSTSDPTTSTSDRTTTTEDTDDSTASSDESASPSDQTTTTSDELNHLTAQVRTPPTTNPSDDNCAEGGWGKIDNVAEGALTRTLTYTDVNAVTVVFTFVFNASKTEATWSSSAPFTGEILVKSANDPASITPVTAATTGTITTPGTGPQGQPQAISHVCVRGTVTTETTTTETTTTTDTTTETTTTDTTTTDTTTDTTGTTTTGTTTDTGGTAGTTQAGGGGGGGVAGTKEAAPEGGGAAREATTASGGLPFTGLHAPLMVLVALGMGAAGLALRKRLNS